MPDVFEGNALLQLVDRLRGFFIGRDEVLSSSGVAVDHGTLSGLTDDDHAQYLLTNGGRTLTGNMSVQASVTIDGVDISAHAASANSHHNQVHAITGADHTVTGTTYQIVGLTGTNTLGLLSPAATVGANTIPIGGTGGAITWSGAQTFSALGTFNAGITVNNTVATFNASATIPTGQKLTTPTIDSSAALTLQPTTNLILDPANNITSMGSGVSIQASSYASQTTGWRVTDAGEADFRYLFVDEMHAKSFIADLEQALAGGQIIAKSVAVLHTAYTLPAAGAASNFTVRDLPSATGMAAFVANDYVRFRSFSRAAGSLTIADAWGVVTGYTDNGNGTQTWTFTRSSGADAGTASGAIAADAIVLDYGTAGNGIHEVNAIDGAYGLNSPYSQVATWASHPRTMTTRTRIGNLRGIFSVANEYGLYAGTGTAVTNRYIRASSESVSLVNVPLALYDGTNNTMLMTAGSSNNSPSLAMGATLPTGPLTGSGIWMGKDGSDYELRAGTITSGALTKGIHWDGAKLNVRGDLVVGPGIGFSTAALLHLKFDGPASTADFQIDLHGHLGQAPTTNSGGVVGAAGLFGKALVTGEATTNLCTNPSAETNVTGFSTDSTGGASITQSTAHRVFGAYSAAWVYGTGGTANLYRASDSPAMASGETFTFSCYLRRSDAAAITGITVYIDSTLAALTPSITAVGNGWYRIAASRTFSGAPGNQVFGVTGLPTTVTVYTDGWQLEKKAYATPYCDGSLGQGHSWSSTAHASTSSRTASNLVYSGVRIPPSGSISAWVRTTARQDSNGNFRWIADGGYTSGVLLYIDSLDVYGVYCGGSRRCTLTATDTNFAADTWHHVATTWDQAASETKLYLDGAQVGSTGSYALPTDDGGGWDIGHYGGNYQWPGQIDDFVLLDRALSADEISAIYGGGPSTAKPVYVTSNSMELLLTGLSGGKVAGNSSGLFGYDASAAEAFALAAGAATWGSQYSGGSALAAGDLVLGDPDARHLFYDASAGTLAIKSNTTTVFSVDSDGDALFSGEIRATSGYIGGTSSGWAISIDSGVAQLSSGGVRLYGNPTNYYGSFITFGDQATDYCSGLVGGYDSDDVMIWAGKNATNKDTAPFRVTGGGSVYSSGAMTLAGSITLSGSISMDGSGGTETGPLLWKEGSVTVATLASWKSASTTNQLSLISQAESSGEQALTVLQARSPLFSSYSRLQLQIGFTSDTDNAAAFYHTNSSNVATLLMSMAVTSSGPYVALFTKTTTGRGAATTGAIEINTHDRGLYIYANSAWQTIATW